MAAAYSSTALDLLTRDYEIDHPVFLHSIEQIVTELFPHVSSSGFGVRQVRHLQHHVHAAVAIGDSAQQGQTLGAVVCLQCGTTLIEGSTRWEARDIMVAGM